MVPVASALQLWSAEFLGRSSGVHYRAFLKRGPVVLVRRGIPCFDGVTCTRVRLPHAPPSHLVRQEGRELHNFNFVDSDVWFWCGVAIAFIGGLAWLWVIRWSRKKAREQRAIQLIRIAQSGIACGRRPMVVGAELQFRAQQLECTEEVARLWRSYEERKNGL